MISDDAEMMIATCNLLVQASWRECEHYCIHMHQMKRLPFIGHITITITIATLTSQDIHTGARVVLVLVLALVVFISGCKTGSLLYARITLLADVRLFMIALNPAWPKQLENKLDSSHSFETLGHAASPQVQARRIEQVHQVFTTELLTIMLKHKCRSFESWLPVTLNYCVSHVADLGNNSKRIAETQQQHHSNPRHWWHIHNGRASLRASVKASSV